MLGKSSRTTGASVVRGLIEDAVERRNGHHQPQAA
jgi:hypothetical protein